MNEEEKRLTGGVQSNPRYALARVFSGRVYHVWDKQAQGRIPGSGGALCGFRPKYRVYGLGWNKADSELSHYPVCPKCAKKWQQGVQNAPSL